jgi:hypothetical protein
MKNYKIAAALIGSFALGVTAASVLHAQSMAPYYEVTEIAVKDQAGYEASGVDKVREALKASGAKLLAGRIQQSRGRRGHPAGQSVLDLRVSKQSGGRESMGRQHSAMDETSRQIRG